MSNSPNLAIPYLEASQAQKHVTVNEALLCLDALIQMAVLDKDLTTPPAGTPADGARYLVGPSATGLWNAKSGQIAAWQDNYWRFYPPKPGWLTWVTDEDAFYRYNGTTWNVFFGGSGGGGAIDGGSP
jgi:hypothetical protein